MQDQSWQECLEGSQDLFAWNIFSSSPLKKPFPPSHVPLSVFSRIINLAMQVVCFVVAVKFYDFVLSAALLSLWSFRDKWKCRVGRCLCVFSVTYPDICYCPDLHPASPRGLYWYFSVGQWAVIFYPTLVEAQKKK